MDDEKGAKASGVEVGVKSIDVDANSSPVDELRRRLSAHPWGPKSAKDYGDEGWDPNLPEIAADAITINSLETGEPDEKKGEGMIGGDENSPYEEVRASVPNTDEVMPVNTIRAWVIGMTLAMFGAAVNTLFSLRQPSIGLGSIISLLVSYGAGNLWAKVMPNKQHTTFGIKWNLNPGPFNVKEQTIIVIMSGVSFSPAYSTDILLAQKVFYKQNFGVLWQLLITITTQSFGYGIAGVMRRFLVYPAAMIWPSSLVSVTLLHSMHEEDKPDPTVWGGSMSRYRYFGWVFLASFLYYWIPGFLMQFLSLFVFVTWLKPNNPLLNQVFGGTSGMGLLPITFDWTQVTGFTGDPLIPPWHAIANTMIGVVAVYIIRSAGLHFGGAWYGKFLPISDTVTYDNTGKNYDVFRILTPNITLNETAYKEYSPLFMSTNFALSYGLSFATLSSLVVYVYIHHRKQIVAQFKRSKTEKPDIHMKLMQKYKEVPEWWYMTVFGLSTLLSLIIITVYPTEFQWWAFLMAVAISCAFTLPIGIVEAVTNQEVTLNVISEFIMGYMQPGKPLALMLFKSYGYVTASQALSFVGDLKLGHYMKIPPRTMFMAQVIATIGSCFVQIAVLDFGLDNIKNVCTQTQPQRFTCPGGRIFFSASVIWGLLGPQRVFSPGQIYSALLWFFPIGAALPIVFHLLAKRFPRSPWKYAMAPVILGGGAAIPPATPLNYIVWGAIGFLFQYWIRKRYFGWWSRLNYLTASGLDVGLAISTLVIFMIFTVNGINAPQWWGNTVIESTMDFNDKAILQTPPDGQTYGPPTW